LSASAPVVSASDLGVANGRIIDVPDLDLRLVFALVFVDADDHFLAAVDTRLAQGGGLFDTQLRHARFDGFRHAAEILNFPDQLARFGNQ